MTTTEQLVTLVAAAGLSAHSQALVAAIEPALRLRTGSSIVAELGASKLGGVPDLPADSAWPRAQLYDCPDRPMTFIAQLAVSTELRGNLPGWPIHSLGLLSFFCLKDDQTDEIFGPAQVLLSAGHERLEPHQPPEDLAAGNRLGELAVHAEPMLTLPDVGSDRFAGLGIEDRDAYRRILAALGYEHPEHRLLGHPTVLQTDVLARAARVGARTLDADLATVPWKLLLQVDHDYDGLRAGFGDSGTLYFCVPQADFATGRLDRVVALGQSM